MGKSISRDQLVDYLDDFLKIRELDDVSVNGLQVPGGEEIKRIAVATDASKDTFQATVDAGCQMLFVHHGIFWTYNRESAITPLMKEKLQLLFNNGVSLYAAHLPLDLHPTCGNNKSLLDLIGLENEEPMGMYQGTPIGLMGDMAKPVDFPSFVEDLENKLDDKVQAFHFNDQPVRKVAMITGGGQSGLNEAKSAGFDTFITGEMAHYMYHVAKDNETNVILAGHYRTETLGPIAVGEHLKQELDLDYVFLDFPTGL